jgi:hypothetical protein
VSEKLKYLEEMLAIMPRQEGTDKLTADLRRRLAQLKVITGAVLPWAGKPYAESSVLIQAMCWSISARTYR